MKKALDYAKQACDTMMRKFAAGDLPPKGKFHYHQGVFLSGVLNTYKVSGEEKYYNYVKEWVDSIIYPDGSVHDFDESMLDDIQPAILLFHLYECTGDERYTTALKSFMSILDAWKRNGAGGFWHKEVHPNEMWLDGLYMAGPLEAEYAQKFGEYRFLDTAIEQALLMKKHMQDERTGLLYHAWDYSKKMHWADPSTGLSEEFWGRALGWYVVAIADILEHVPLNHPKRELLIEAEKEVIRAIAKYQDPQTGMWYQVVDKGDREDNWLEVSCSSLFSYAMAKGVRLGILEPKYTQIAVRGYKGVISSLKYEGDNLLLGNVCVGTGVSSYEYYISRPTSINDLHGMGAFLLMCAELAVLDV